MGFIKDITRSVTKPFKKIIKSPAGIAAILALGVPAYAKYGAAAGWPGTTSGMLGPGSKMAGLGNWLYGTTTPGTGLGVDKYGSIVKNMMTKTPGLWGRSGTLGKAAIVGGATAGLTAAGLPDEEDLPEEFTDDSGQAQYLKNRALYEDEWSDWLMDMNPGMSKTEALEEVRSKPMFSEGGRVKAQGGLFAGQMPGRHPSMNQMNPMAMNQGLGAPNLGPRSMGMTPGMTPGRGQMDPRMAQMMQGQRRPTMGVPKESEDTELIQLIKMLTALGIPMEQLRGRTKEELVEMLVSVSGKGKSGTEIIEGEAIEERGGEEVEAAEEEVIQAAHGGRIGYQQGTKMASAPGLMESLNDLSMEKFGKSLDELTPQEYDLLMEINADLARKPAQDIMRAAGGGRIGYQRGGPQDWGQEKAAETLGSANVPDTNPYSDVAQRDVRDLNQQIAANRTVTPKVTGDGFFSNYNKNVNLKSRGSFIDKDRRIFDDLIARNKIRETGGVGAWDWIGEDSLESNATRKMLQDKYGYTGGITTPGTGGGGGSPSYTTAGAGAGAGTTTPTDDEDYYKFAEWDKWLMPGETTATPLMPGGYKSEILANRGGLMRTGYALGHPVIPSKDGMQLDMRDAGGYQPHGKAEKHDDVRALLAQGEFVMTSDAVKGIGGGDRELGAKKMYNLMHNMEAMA